MAVIPPLVVVVVDSDHYNAKPPIFDGEIFD